MSLDPSTPDLDRLAPYARDVLERAAALCLKLHAEEIGTEHFLVVLLRDEDAGATRLVLHAFADPANLAEEALALSPGILVVASRKSLPFSVLGVRALEIARGEERLVSPGSLLHASLGQLAPDVTSDLTAAGFLASGLADHLAGEAGQVASGSGFFAGFSDKARRVLGAACRTAAGLERDSIGPAHIAVAALDTDGTLADAVRLSGHRTRLVVAGRDGDETPPAERSLRPDADFAALLESLAPGSDTTALFGRILAAGRDDLRLLLSEQKITPALHERAAASFGDPGLA